MKIRGQCHCGNLSFELSTARPLAPRACQCRYCRAHQAVCASDPEGLARVRVRDERLLHRYRFARRTADCLVCRRCGGYLGAVLETADGLYSTLNLNNATDLELPAAAPADYDGESYEERVHRRASHWTPTEVRIQCLR